MKAKCFVGEMKYSARKLLFVSSAQKKSASFQAKFILQTRPQNCRPEVHSISLLLLNAKLSASNLSLNPNLNVNANLNLADRELKSCEQ